MDLSIAIRGHPSMLREVQDALERVLPRPKCVSYPMTRPICTTDISSSQSPTSVSSTNVHSSYTDTNCLTNCLILLYLLTLPLLTLQVLRLLLT